MYSIKKNISNILISGMLGISLVSMLFSGCSSDNGMPEEVQIGEVRAYVACEGNFTKGTASLNAIMEDGTVENDLFYRANKRPLGDVAQSFSWIGENLFVTLNNSEKIEVVNEANYSSVATIIFKDHKISPQYIMPIDDHRAVVSDLWNPFLWVIDTKEYKVLGEIPAVASSKQMIVADNKLFVTIASKKIAIISLETLTVTAELDIPVVGDSKLVMDKDAMIWALACGFDDDPNSIIPKTVTSLYCINPRTCDVVKTVTFPSDYTVSRSGARLDINATKDKLYLNAIHNKTEGIYGFPIGAEQLPAEALFTYSDKVEMLYNMAISPEETIFICDALDYSQRGWVYEFDLTGKVLNEYKVGIIPHYILFK